MRKVIKAKVGLPGGKVARQHRPGALGYSRDSFLFRGTIRQRRRRRRCGHQPSHAAPEESGGAFDGGDGDRSGGQPPREWERRFTIRRAHLLAAARRGEHQEAAEAVGGQRRAKGLDCHKARHSKKAGADKRCARSTARVANIVRQAACRPGWRRWRISRRPSQCCRFACKSILRATSTNGGNMVTL